MKCLHCEGTLEQTRINYTANRKGYHLIIDDVPAWVCQQCGEPLFDEATVEAIQEVFVTPEFGFAMLLIQALSA